MLTHFSGSSYNTVADYGRDFMIDLLIQSLMVEGNLESAFQNAVKDELSQDKNDNPSSVVDISNSTPLLQLARELLRSCVDKCLSRFHANKIRPDAPVEDNKIRNRNAIMELLLKLQRLFIGSIYTVFMAHHQSNCLGKGMFY
jgi:hypothetical protein